MNTNTNLLLEWHAPSRPDYERSHEWYMIAGALSAVMIAYGILTSAWGLSLTFALLPGLYYLVRNQNHRRRRIRLFEMGIEIDGQMTPWGEWKEFWILEGHGYHELHVLPVKHFRSELMIQTGDIDPYLVRDVLNNFLPQVANRRERILDAIIRFCKL